MSSGSGGVSALKRLMTEYKGNQALFAFIKVVLDLSLNAPEGISAGPISEDNFFVWEALIEYKKAGNLKAKQFLEGLLEHRTKEECFQPL